MNMNMNIHAYIHTCTCMHIHIYKYVYIYIHICVYIHIYMYIHTHNHTYIHTYIHAHAHAHAHIHTHMHIHTHLRSTSVRTRHSRHRPPVAGYFTQGRGLAPRPSGSPRLVLNPGATRDALALGRGRSPREVLASASFPASAAMNGYRDALLARPLLVAGLCLRARLR